MTCEKCQAAQSSYTLTRRSAGGVSVSHLCESCMPGEKDEAVLTCGVRIGIRKKVGDWGLLFRQMAGM